jgi:glycosyltransferase involved in cell wall biosynthesis
MVFNLVCEQRRAGCYIPYVILLNDGVLAQRLRNAGVTVTVFPESELRFVEVLRKIRAELRRSSPAIVHTHRQKENILGATAASLCGRIPSVRTEHGCPEHHASLGQPRRILQTYLDRWVGRHVQSRIVAVSRDLAERLAKVYPRERIRTITNGLDIEYVRRLASLDSSELRAPAPSFRIAIVGRLVSVKRHDIFLQVAALLETQSPGVFSFYVMGDGPLRAELESSEWAKNPHLTFLGFRPDALALLASMDALVMTSDHEGTPMVALEAMALGVPVVARKTGGLAAILDGGCGVLVDSEDISQLASALQRLRQDLEARRTIASLATARVASRFSVAHMSEAYAAVYDELALAHANSISTGHSLR